MNWYFRHEGSVSGPVPHLALERYLLLGRIEIEDEVSLDQNQWQKIRDVPEFAKTIARIVEFEHSQQEVIEQIVHDQEMAGQALPLAAVPAPTAAPAEVRVESGSESATGAAAEVNSIEEDAAIREKLKTGELIDLESARARLFTPVEKEDKGLKGYLLLATIVVLALFAVYFYRPVNPIQIGIVPECKKKPAPEVNWKSCDKGGEWLNGAKLSHANLEGVKFNSAQLENADLDNATLANADLNFANLKGANLEGADLSGADLRDADLTAAKLTGANLTGARLERTIMPDGKHCAEGSLGRCN